MWWEERCRVDGSFDQNTLNVTPETRKSISLLKQGSEEWLHARYGRLTASNFGAAAGNHLPGARKKLLENMLWPEFAKLTGMAAKFAAYGTQHESVAREVYAADRQSRGNACLRVFETGLLVSLEHGWLGSSPDFVVEECTAIHERPAGPLANEHHSRQPYIISHPHGAALFIKNTPACSGGPSSEEPHTITQGCGEIKCPATHTLYSRSEKHAVYGFPAYYYDQIQGIMAINNWPWCDTVVHTPHETEVIRFHANEAYWREDLFPKLRRFYYEDFLPRLSLRIKGKLKRGEVDARLVIPSVVFELGLDLGVRDKKKRKRSTSERENMKTLTLKP